MLVIQNLALTSLEEEIFLITVPGTRPLFTPVKGETHVIVYTAYYILLGLTNFPEFKNTRIQFSTNKNRFFYSKL